MIHSLTINKRKTIYFNVLCLATIYLVLANYAPHREFLYSKHAYALLFILFIIFFALHFLRGCKIYLPMILGPVLFYLLTLPFIFLSTILYSVEEYKVTGAINNIIYQVTFVGFLIFYISWNRLTAKQIALQFAIVVTIFGILSALAAYQLYLTGGVLFGPFYFEDANWPQLYGFFQSPNFFINSIGLGIFSSIYLVYHFKSKLGFKIISFLSLILLSVSSILSGSKGGIFFIIFSLLLSSLLIAATNLSKSVVDKSFKILFYVIIMFLLLSALVFCYLNYIGMSSHWFFRSIIRLQSISTGTGRLDLWATSFQILAEASVWQLLFGHGNEYIISNFGASTHNDHLKVIIEYGFIAYVFLWLIFIVSIASILKKSAVNGIAVSFFISSVLLFAWFRPLLNAGLFSAGILGFSFLVAVIFASFRASKYEDTLLIQ